MYVCMYVCLYVCMYACMYVFLYACMYVCMYVCMHACVCFCVSMFACMRTEVDERAPHTLRADNVHYICNIAMGYACPLCQHVI